MTLPHFDYVAPASLAEASALLLQHGAEARLTAGGTDLLLHMRHGKVRPRLVVGLRKVPGLDALRWSPEEGLVVGAMARLAQVGAHPEVARRYPALRDAIAACATVQIRNMGTVVGNLCNASPSADTACPLLALDATVHAVGPQGERVVPLDRFFAGPGRNVLEPGEIVRELRVPPPAGPSALERISQRSAVDIAAVLVTAVLARDGDGAVRHARLALGAVAPTPRRALDAEALLLGQAPDPPLVERAAALAAETASPITDVRASAEWRRAMVRVLARRALERALGGAA